MERVDFTTATNRKERRLAKYKKKALNDVAKNPAYVKTRKHTTPDVMASHGNNGGSK